MMLSAFRFKPKETTEGAAVANSVSVYVVAQLDRDAQQIIQMQEMPESEKTVAVNRYLVSQLSTMQRLPAQPSRNESLLPAHTSFENAKQQLLLKNSNRYGIFEVEVKDPTLLEKGLRLNSLKMAQVTIPSITQVYVFKQDLNAEPTVIQNPKANKAATGEARATFTSVIPSSKSISTANNR